MTAGGRMCAQRTCRGSFSAFLPESSALHASGSAERSNIGLDARELPITSRIFLKTADG